MVLREWKFCLCDSTMSTYFTFLTSNIHSIYEVQMKGLKTDTINIIDLSQYGHHSLIILTDFCEQSLKIAEHGVSCVLL